MTKSGFRIERDSLGELKVPADALWGPQTQRAVENFPISGLRMPRDFIRALGLINVAIIARILGPEDFGLVAMAMLVLGFIESWLAFGLENACVQRKDMHREHLDTAWSMRIIQGAVVTILIACAAPFAATYFRDARVTLLIWVLCTGIFIASLGNIGIVMFRRELDFLSEFKLQATARLIAFLLGLCAALVLLALALFPIAPYLPAAVLAEVAAIGAVVGINHKLYRFYLSRRGLWFAGRALPLHCLYYLYSSAAFASCWCIYAVRGRRDAAIRAH